jgi:hypothetical protein
VFCKIIRKDKSLSVVFDAVNSCKKSYVTKYKELITQVFNIALTSGRRPDS